MPVVENARIVGRVTLIAETADLVGRLFDVVRNALTAAALAMAVGFAVAWRLGRTLTRPLTALARTMDAVRENHDYARRAVLPPGAEPGDEVGRLICVGVLCMFVFHIFENVGMTQGIMPVTGIPLPFVSYGGSATIASFAAIGLVLNVHMRRYN